MAREKIPVCFTLTQEENATLREMAQVSGISKSVIVGTLIRDARDGKKTIDLQK